MDFNPNDQFGPFAGLVPGNQAAPPAAPRAPMVGPPPVAQPDPSGYRQVPGGMAPVHGGPADPTRPGGALDPEAQLSGPALDLQAENYLNTNNLPSLGMGGSSGARIRILNRAAEMARAAGVDGADLATMASNYRALRATLQQQQQMLGNVRSMEGTTNDNLEQLRAASNALPGQTEYPLANRLWHAVQRNVTVAGHTQISGYDDAYGTATAELARLMTGSQSGNGTVTDAAREDAERLIPYGASPSQMNAAIQQAHADIHNREASYERTIAGLQSQLSGRPVQTPQEARNADPAWQAASQQFPGVVSNVGSPPGGIPPTGPAGGPTGGRAVNAAGPDIQAADIPRPEGDLRLSGRTDAHQPFTPEQQANFVNAIRGYQPGTLTVDAYRREFERNLGRPVNGNEQANVDYYNGTGQYRGQPAGRVSTAFQYENPDDTQTRHDTEAASGRLAAMTPEQRFYESQNPLNHPVETGIEAALHIPLGAPRQTEGGASFERGVADIPTLSLRDEINGMARGGTGIADERALDASDWQNHPFLRGSGEVAGALAIPAAGPEVGGFRAALMSGAQGFGYGIGSGEGDLAQRAPSGALGLATGLALPPLLNLGGRGARALLSRAPQISQDAQRIAQAGADESVPLSRPIVDPTSRARMMRLESNIGGHAPVRQSLDATQQGIENRVGQLAPNGVANERGAMGARIQQDVLTAGENRARQIGSVYDRASTMAGDTRVLPGTAVQRLDRHIAELGQNEGTNAPLLDYLRTVRGDLVDGNGILRPKTVAAIRDMRTNLRGNINNANLAHTPAERIMDDVLDGARDDVDFFLGAQNPGANQLYQQADKAWQAHRAELTQVADRLVGRADNPIGGGEVMNKVTGLMAGDVPRLTRMMATLQPETRRDFAATVAARAGYKSPDEPFSLQQFMAWQRSIPNTARQAVFGPEGAKSIQNLTLLTRALQDTQKALNNTRSGAARNAAAFWQSVLGGFLPGGAVGVMTGTGATTAALAAGTAQAGVAGAQALARRLSARALMNPDMSRWLAVAPRMTTAGAIRSHIGRLAGIAARNPGLEQEILPFRDSLLNAANDNAERAAAASDPNQNQQQPR